MEDDRYLKELNAISLSHTSALKEIDLLRELISSNTPSPDTTKTSDNKPTQQESHQQKTSSSNASPIDNTLPMLQPTPPLEPQASFSIAPHAVLFGLKATEATNISDPKEYLKKLMHSLSLSSAQ